MGDLTLSGMRSELAVMFKNRSDADFTSSTRQNMWINDAYSHMTHPAVHRFRETQTTFTIALVASQFQYTIDAATVGFQIYAVRSATYYRSTSTTRDPTVVHWNLEPISQYQLDERQIPSASSTTEPRQYAIDGTTFSISNLPSSTEAGYLIHCRCWREPAALSSDSSTTVLPRAWDRILLKGAKWIAESDLGYRELSEQSKQDYVALINEYAGRGESEQLEAEDEGFSMQFVMYPTMPGTGVGR